MKAQILYDIGNIKYCDAEKPVPAADEALVKVRACGICGSDVPRIYKTGAHNMPLIPGHEFSGIVEQCESAPELVGKRVGIFPLKPCMKCTQCKNKHYEMCENYDYLGSRCNGGFAEYVAVPVWNLIPIPDGITDFEAAMLEPMCVAVHAMRRVGLGVGSTGNSAGADAANGALPDADAHIFICGLGTIGLLLALFLKDAGYKNVYCIYNKDIQRDKLTEMGFSPEFLCDYRTTDVAKFVQSATAKTGTASGIAASTGAGADLWFECIGNTESYERAVSYVAPLGKVMLVGNPASDMELKREVYWKILRNQLTLTGTWNSSFYGNPELSTAGPGSPADLDDWNYVLSRLPEIRKSGFSPENLITHKYSLADMQTGLEIMRDKEEEYIKIMIET